MEILWTCIGINKNHLNAHLNSSNNERKPRFQAQHTGMNEDRAQENSLANQMASDKFLVFQINIAYNFLLLGNFVVGACALQVTALWSFKSVLTVISLCYLVCTRCIVGISGLFDSNWLRFQCVEQYEWAQDRCSRINFEWYLACRRGFFVRQIQPIFTKASVHTSGQRRNFYWSTNRLTFNRGPAGFFLINKTFTSCCGWRVYSSYQQHAPSEVIYFVSIHKCISFRSNFAFFNSMWYNYISIGLISVDFFFFAWKFWKQSVYLICL